MNRAGLYISREHRAKAYRLAVGCDPALENFEAWRWIGSGIDGGPPMFQLEQAYAVRFALEDRVTALEQQVALLAAERDGLLLPEK